MPVTAGTILPIAPVAPAGDASVPTMVFMADITTIVTGDIVIWDASPDARLIDSNTATGDNIVGVAMEPETSVSGQIMVALPLPGVLFEGNIVNGSAQTDVASGDRTAHIGLRFGVVEATVPALACIDREDTAAGTACLRTLRWAGRQKGFSGTVNPFAATLAVTNPRIVFAFGSSWWNPVA